MPKIVLINPPMSLEERYGELGKIGTRLPPLGLALLAANFIKHGFEADIIDASALDYDIETTVKKILVLNTNYVGITAITANVHTAADLTTRLKEEAKNLNKEITIILGGVHITSCPRETFERYPQFDYGVIGEGDISSIELLKCLEEKGDPSKVNGIVFINKNGKEDENKIIITPPPPLFKNMDSLPMPAWNLLPDLPTYYRPPANAYQQLPAMSLITSRGCPGRCTFCDRTTSGHFVRGYSADYIINMIKKLQKDYGIKEFIFHDDNFVTMRPRLKEICQRIIDEKLGISWSCTARVDMVNPEVLSLMKKAGCWQIAYGIESGDQRILDFLKKGITLEKTRQCLKWTKEAGIKSRGYFMIGVPTETEESIKKTIEFMKTIELTDFHMSIFCPYPGTETYKIIKEDPSYGTLIDRWEDMTAWKIIFVPRGLTAEKLLYYQKKAMREFYYRPKILLRYFRMLFNPKTAPEVIKAGIVFSKFVLKESFGKKKAG